MPKKSGTQSQIEKLNYLQKEAEKVSKSTDLLRRIGACTVYAGIVEFCTIQVARLVEQIILKGQFHQGQKPEFEPHEDAYFYDEKVSTRNILKQIQKLLPFKAAGNTNSEDAEKFNTSIKEYIKHVDKFLKQRNVLIHHMGNPNKSAEDIRNLCEVIPARFQKIMETHTVSMKAGQPFRFGLKELDYFYNENS